MGETRHSHSNPHIFLWKATSLVSPRDRIEGKGKGRWELTQTCYRPLSSWARFVASLISLLHILSPTHIKEITTHTLGQVPIGELHQKSLLFSAVEPQSVLQMGETNIINSRS